MNFIKEHMVAVMLFGGLFLMTLFLPKQFIIDATNGLKDQGVASGLAIVGFILFTTTVVAPLNSVALIPIASGVYGWVLSSIVAIVAWGLAAVVAFMIARHLGRPILKSLGVLGSIEKYEKKIPVHLGFWAIVLLRMMIPVDVLSYAFGLFSSVSLPVYTVATFVGIAPFAIIFSLLGDAFFAGNSSLLFVGGAGAILFLIIVWHFYKRQQN